MSKSQSLSSGSLLDCFWYFFLVKHTYKTAALIMTDTSVINVPNRHPIQKTGTGTGTSTNYKYYITEQHGTKSVYLYAILFLLSVCVVSSLTVKLHSFDEFGFSVGTLLTSHLHTRVIVRIYAFNSSTYVHHLKHAYWHIPGATQLPWLQGGWHIGWSQADPSYPC